MRYQGERVSFINWNTKNSRRLVKTVLGKPCLKADLFVNFFRAPDGRRSIETYSVKFDTLTLANILCSTSHSHRTLLAFPPTNLHFKEKTRD